MPVVEQNSFCSMDNSVATPGLSWRRSRHGFAAFALLVVCLVGSPVDTIFCVFTACSRDALRIQVLQLEGGGQIDDPGIPRRPSPQARPAIRKGMLLAGF